MVLMEEKQLNFNQPLLSVRRVPSKIAPAENERKAHSSRPSLPPLPYYKSDLKSGPVRNPGVVPFKWECIPGRPKDNNKADTCTLKKPPPAPKLPPGRIANHTQRQTDELLRDSSTSNSRYRSETNISHSLESSSPDKDLSEIEESDKENEEKDITSSEDENVTYVDARETLSRSESFFNCSVSGMSGLDGPESFGPFSDPQTRDIMMGRFLPAAKAVASETPAFTSRRQSVAREQEKPITPVVKLKQQYPQAYAFLDNGGGGGGGEEEEEEEYEDDESDGPEDLSVKFCGLMPRFRMLNPIPGIKDHVQVVSSVRSVRTKPAYAQAYRDKHRDGAKNNRGDLKKGAQQYTPTPGDESLLNGHLGRFGVARQKNASPQLFLEKEKQLLGLPGEPRDCGELELAAHDSEEFTSIVKPTYEKTLYIDSERTVESRHSNSSTSESRGSNPSVDYSLQDIKSLCCVDEKVLPEAKSSETTDSNAFTNSYKSSQDFKEAVTNLQKHEDVNLIVDIETPLKPEVKTIEHCKNGSSPLTLTPLLPKSPSESWLSRTLPSMSSRNPSSKSYLQNHGFRASPVDTKRERVLKTSNLQNMLLSSARELAPISEI